MGAISWTAPRTWVAGEVITASIGNTHWRDNLNAVCRIIDYAQITGNVTISGASQAAATTAITGASVSYSGSLPVLIEVFIPRLLEGTGSGTDLHVHLFEDGSALTELGSEQSGDADPHTFWAGLRKTPSSGSHTYSIRIHRTTTDGTLQCGSGTAGALAPAFQMITTANLT